MIKFLFNGLLRDKSRSRLPIIVVAIGVTLTVLMHAYIKGFMGDTIEMNARFFNGHVKVMTKAYAENMDQKPNDLAILDADKLTMELQQQFPEIEWSKRIHFGGLVDAPDENGETRSQGPAVGMGIDLLTDGSKELQRLNLEKSLIRGSLPKQNGEALLSDKFAQKLKVEPGDNVTLIGSTMDGSMTFYNFIITGTVTLGHESLDRGTIIADLEDIGQALNMENTAGEIVGFFDDGYYNDEVALEVSEKFASLNRGETGDYSPVMKTLSQQGEMGTYVYMADIWSTYISVIFIFAMSLVLWNAGLLGGLRRYGEIGIRLAMGEEKGHVYKSMIYESVMIGITGSVLGTMIGLFFAWLLQKYGMDISNVMQGSSMMMPGIVKARITAQDFYFGFIPGLISTVIGTMLSGIGIFKRQTANLFKELEA